MTKLLLLGGTTEASHLAAHLVQAWVLDDPVAGRQAVFSYAGRTARPAAQPLPCRIGGFGGVSGLVDYIVNEISDHVSAKDLTAKCSFMQIYKEKVSDLMTSNGVQLF